MSTKDAVKMILIMAEADNGCPQCVQSLVDDVISTWPEVDWEAVVAALRKSSNYAGERGAEHLEHAIKGEPFRW